jgi:hypothetical protein
MSLGLVHELINTKHENATARAAGSQGGATVASRCAFSPL